MPKMTPNQLRQSYLDFFAERGHSVIPSAPIVPENDPTTLFTGSGMQPMVPYLLGKTHPKGNRIVDSQKCFRSQDIEEVGDNRHTTFFEMLGNWSLGDYFKQDQLRWFFEFMTQAVGLDPERIYVTVFRGSQELGIPRDDESVQIWKKLFGEVGIEALDVDMSEREGMQGGRIFYYNETKNWWSRSGVPAAMPTGEPGGPDSEVFFDFGAELQIHENSPFKDEPCHVNCDCGRFVEIGNSVFMQYQKQPDGSFKELPQKNVDFGGGLERLLAAANLDPDVFTTEMFQGILAQIERVSNRTYLEGDLETKRSFRVIADHLRAATMLTADGVYPSNKEQGYVARRLVRRAIRYAKMMGVEQPFVAEVAQAAAELYAEAYPDVLANLSQIQTILSDEEAKFRKTLAKGLKEIEKLPELTGETAFKLYETYGFPLELTQEIAIERGQDVDKTAFERAFNQHRDRSRTASAGKFKGGLADHSEITTQYHTATHLLHAALRQILGESVQQKGSNITAERLRFDFSYPEALTSEQITSVEQQINDWIAADLPVTRQVMAKQAALASGATAFFLDKYPDEVSVYTVGNDPDSDWISKEFCGGPHVERTGQIKPMTLFKEQAVAAGTRRLYARFA